MKVKLYTLQNCVYCLLSKDLLNKKNISFEEINLEENYLLFDELFIRHNYSKVPMIFINDEFIGGYTELNKYLENYIL